MTLILIILSSLWMISFSVAPVEGQNTLDCAISFDDFAYRAPLIDRNLMSPQRAPDWDIESLIPVEDIIASDLLPVGSRQVDGQTEIWIRHSPITYHVTPDDAFLIYTYVYGLLVMCHLAQQVVITIVVHIITLHRCKSSMMLI